MENVILFHSFHQKCRKPDTVTAERPQKLIKGIFRAYVGAFKKMFFREFSGYSALAIFYCSFDCLTVCFKVSKTSG
jgi:hypothetical protein